MGGDITNEVLAEQIGRLHDDLGDIKRYLDRLVSRELYEAHRAGELSRLDALERRADQLDEARKRERDEAAKSRSSQTRFVLGTIAVPVLLVILQLYLAARGK